MTYKTSAQYKFPCLKHGKFNQNVPIFQNRIRNQKLKVLQMATVNSLGICSLYRTIITPKFLPLKVPNTFSELYQHFLCVF